MRDKFQKAEEIRNTGYACMRGLSPSEFWRDCRDRFDCIESVIDENADESWESDVYRPKTRNKTIATSAALLASGLGIEIEAQDMTESTDREMSVVAEDIFDWSLDRERWDMKLVRAVMDLRISGTVHLFEDIVWDKRKVKEIKSVDFESGEFEFEEDDRIDFKGCRAEIIPNEEIYIADAFESDIQNQSYVIRRKVSDYDSVRIVFEKYANWKYVNAGSQQFLTADANDDKESEDQDDERVEIVWCWDKPNDLYRIIVNGVLMNGANEGFPYPHKMYPIAKTIAIPFADQRFYWGNSDPNILRDEQDLDNDLWRMFIDSEKLRIKPPIGVSNTELANRDLVVPGVMYPLGLEDRIEPMLAVSQGVGGNEFKLLELTERQMDESTLDPLMTGQSGSGDATATEVRAIVGSAERLRGFAQAFLGDLLVQHAHLRLPNILWFLTHDDEYQKVVKDAVKLSTGKDGRKVIQFADAIDIPSSEEIMVAEASAEKMGRDAELIYVDRDAVQDYRYHVQLSPAPKPRRGGSLKVLRALEKYRLYVQNPIFNQRRNAQNLAEAMGDDPKEMVQEQAPAMPAMPNANSTEMPKGQAQEMAMQEMI